MDQYLPILDLKRKKKKEKNSLPISMVEEEKKK